MHFGGVVLYKPRNCIGFPNIGQKLTYRIYPFSILDLKPLPSAVFGVCWVCGHIYLALNSPTLLSPLLPSHQFSSPTHWDMEPPYTKHSTPTPPLTKILIVEAIVHFWLRFIFLVGKSCPPKPELTWVWVLPEHLLWSYDPKKPWRALNVKHSGLERRCGLLMQSSFI